MLLLIFLQFSYLAVHLFVPVLHGCAAEVLLDELAEERRVGHVHPMGNLLGRQRRVEQIVAYLLYQPLANPGRWGLSRFLLADDGEILGRDAQLAGKVFHGVVAAVVLGQQHQEVLHLFALHRGVLFFVCACCLGGFVFLLVDNGQDVI